MVAGRPSQVPSTRRQRPAQLIGPQDGHSATGGNAGFADTAVQWCLREEVTSRRSRGACGSRVTPQARRVPSNKSQIHCESWLFSSP